MTTIPPKISTTQETGDVVGKKGYDPHMTGEGRGVAGVGDRELLSAGLVR